MPVVPALTWVFTVRPAVGRGAWASAWLWFMPTVPAFTHVLTFSPAAGRGGWTRVWLWFSATPPSFSPALMLFFTLRPVGRARVGVWVLLLPAWVVVCMMGAPCHGPLVLTVAVSVVKTVQQRVPGDLDHIQTIF